MCLIYYCSSLATAAKATTNIPWTLCARQCAQASFMVSFNWLFNPVRWAAVSHFIREDAIREDAMLRDVK